MYRACGTTVSTRGGFFHSRIRGRSIRRRNDLHERQPDGDALDFRTGSAQGLQIRRHHIFEHSTT